MEKSLYARIKEELEKNPEVNILKERSNNHYSVELDNTALTPFGRIIYIAPTKGIFTLPELNRFMNHLLPSFPHHQRHTRPFLEYDDDHLLFGFKSYGECVGEMTLKLTKEGVGDFPPFLGNFKGPSIFGDTHPEGKIEIYMFTRVWIFPCSSLGNDILEHHLHDDNRIKKSVLEEYKKPIEAFIKVF